MTAPSLWRRIGNSFARSRRKQGATLDISPEGIVYARRSRETKILWSDITRIDAGMRDYLSFDGLYVIVFVGTTRLEIDELDDGFRIFEIALFERWPQIRERWNALLAANPHEPQHETLWRRDG